MAGRTWIAGLVAIFGLAACAPGQTAAGFTLAGIVVKAGTNQPLNHVLVTIRYTQRRDLHLSYITDTDGRFVFQNLPLGKWDLSAEKNGYPMEPYQGYEGYSTAVAVGAGIDTTHIVFPLAPSGILSGTVVDEQGDPVRQAQVFLFRNGVISGKLTTQRAGEQQTDSAGEFSFGSIQPGTYYVAVSARPWYAKNFTAFGGRMMNVNGQIVSAGEPASEGVQHDERDVAYPITYYGDATDGAAAEPITVQEGNEARIRIALRAVPAWRITIPKSSRGATIETLGPAGIPLNLPAQFTSNGEEIEMLGVPAGRYIIRLIGKKDSASKIVDVAGDQTVDFIDSPAIALTAHVKWEGSSARVPEAAFFRLEGESMQNGVSGRIRSDGSLQIEQNNVLAQGRYRVVLNAPNFAISSIQAKGAQYAKGVLDITGSEIIDLSVTATSDLAKINGVALRDHVPCPAAMIVLLPADGNPDAIRRDQSDSDGTFTLPNVLPGRYTLVAIDNGRDLAYQDPAVIAKYLPQGQAVDVPLKSPSPLTTPVQTR